MTIVVTTEFLALGRIPVSIIHAEEIVKGGMNFIHILSILNVYLFSIPIVRTPPYLNL